MDKPTVIMTNPAGDMKTYAVDYNEARERWGIIVTSNELGGVHGWEPEVYAERRRALTRLNIIRTEAANSSYWKIWRLVEA